MISDLPNWPETFLAPDYNGRSLANVPAMTADLLGVPLSGLPSVIGDWRDKLGDGVERVVLLLIDALGWNLVEPLLDKLEVLKSAVFTTTLTSIAPSTTVAALTSLWTGMAPSQHGVLGLNLFFPEQATMAQMLSFKASVGSQPNALVEAGVDPKKFVPVPSISQQFTAAGVPVYSFKRRSLVKSTLSQMHGRGNTENFGVHSYTDLLVQMRQFLEARRGKRFLISSYWESVDLLSHVYGWESESVQAEMRMMLSQLEQLLFAPLSKEARQGTAVFLVADHGQTQTPASQHIFLSKHPQLTDLTFMRPAGEPRALYLYCRAEQKKPLLNYLNNELGHALFAVESQTALDAGLFGPPPYAPETRRRLADLVCFAKEGYALFTPQEERKAHKMVSRHGSLTSDEMLVPLFGWRLDS